MMHQPRLKQCFTIGYGNEPIERFMDRSGRAGIDTIIDVRSSPYSRFNPAFNRENLKKFLKLRNIDYLFMGDRLGGRYSDEGLLFSDGTVNYRRVQETELFKEGIRQLLAIISGGKAAALMCAEKEPERCHRFALISPVLQSQGISVIHIRPDGTLQAHEDLERELVKSFYDTSQIDLSGEQVDFIGRMYGELNRRIAFKREPSDFRNERILELPEDDEVTLL